MTTNEEKVLADLAKRFEFLAAGSRVARVRRIWAEAPYERSREVLEFAARELGFSHLCMVTGLDEGENLGLIYHVAQPDDGIVLNLKTRVPKTNPAVKSVVDLFPDSVIYEREIADLFGVQVSGLPEGKRDPRPDSWPAGQYPLRKDWNPESLSAADAAATRQEVRNAPEI